VQPLRWHCLARQIMLDDECGHLLCVLRLGQGHECRYELRQCLPRRIPADPIEKLFARRLIGRGMGEAQEIAMRPATPLAVLHDLKRELVYRLSRVPGPNRPPEPAPPAAKALDRFRKLEKMGARAADHWNRRKGKLLRLVIAERSRQRKRKDRRIVLGRAT